MDVLVVYTSYCPQSKLVEEAPRVLPYYSLVIIQCLLTMFAFDLYATLHIRIVFRIAA